MSEWKLVPVEADEAMENAFTREQLLNGAGFADCYAALLAAVPSSEWVKTSDRLPTREDADEQGKVWALLCGKVVLEDWNFIFDLLWWMPKPHQQPPEPPGFSDRVKELEAQLTEQADVIASTMLKNADLRAQVAALEKAIHCPYGRPHQWDGDGQCKNCCDYATDLIDNAVAGKSDG